MLGSVRILAVLALAALSTKAFGWHQGRTVYYYPAPVLVVSPRYDCVVAPFIVGPPAVIYVPAAPVPRPLAQPVPAPPSRNPIAPRTQEPPLSVPAVPNVRESRKAPNVAGGPSYFNAYAVAPSDGGKLVGDRCRVSFWNLTGQAITLKVGDKTEVIAPNGPSRSMELDRQFVWRVDEREPQSERVPEGESGLVIVIRR